MACGRLRSGRPYGAEDWVEVISHRLGIVREPRRRVSATRKDALTPEFARNSRKDALTPEFPPDLSCRPPVLRTAQARTLPSAFLIA